MDTLQTLLLLQGLWVIPAVGYNLVSLARIRAKKPPLSANDPQIGAVICGAIGGVIALGAAGFTAAYAALNAYAVFSVTRGGLLRHLRADTEARAANYASPGAWRIAVGLNGWFVAVGGVAEAVAIAALVGGPAPTALAPGEPTPEVWALWEPPPGPERRSPDPVLTGRTPPSEAATGPDVVLVTVDTWRADRLGIHGSPRTATSRVLQRWADAGATFDAAFAPSPWTWPTLASLASGLHPVAHGAVTPESALCDGGPTLAEALWGAGYRTGFAGSSHHVEPAGPRPRDTGFSRGFEYFWARGNESGDRVLREADAFLAGAGDAAVFLHLHLYEPHCRYDPDHDALIEATSAPFAHAGRTEPPPDFARAVRKANACHLVPVVGGDADEELPDSARGTDPQAYLDAYDGELVETDRLLGRVEALLRRHGRWDDAWIVATGDHGEEFGDHGRIGHGWNAYAETARVPLVVRPPAGSGLPGGLRVTGPVSLLDLPPTLARVVGASPPRHWQGRDLSDALRGEPLEPATVLVASDYEGADARLLVEGPLALHRDPRDGRRLFADPLHLRDLAALRGGDAARLDAALDAAEADYARGKRCEAGAKGLTPEQRERLEALGYLGG